MHGEETSVSLKPDILFYIGGDNGWPITNTFLTSLLFSIILIGIVAMVIKKINLRPSKFQLILEDIIMGGYNFTLNTLENKKITNKVYPLLASLFFVILFFNLAKFIPGIESITFHDKHLFKPVHSDLNMTLALGVVAWLAIQILGVVVLGFWKYGRKFIQFKKVKGIPIINPIGLLEIISEIAKMFSLSFRLFMNIFVGGILIMLLQAVSHYVTPTIGMFFEIFVAFLQAGLFALLTLFYIKLAISEPH